MPENNQDLTKVYELIQKNNEQIHQDRKWDRVTGAITTFLMLIPTLLLVWEKFKGKKLTPKQRLMNNDAVQARHNLNHKTKQAKLNLNNEAMQAKIKLEKEIILKEVQYGEDLNKMETGLDNLKGLENKFDFLNNFQQKGEKLLKDKVNQVKEKLDTFNKKDKKN